MPVESAILGALTTLVTGRVYPDVAPAGVGRPYIIYQKVGGEVITPLDNSLPSKVNGRFQIAAWGTSRPSIAALILQVEAAMVSIGARPIGSSVSDYETDTKLYGSRQDFSLWSDR